MDFDRQTVSHHEDVYVSYDVLKYKEISRERWDPWDDKPIENASEYCYALRRMVNSDESRVLAIMEIMEKHPKAIIFYNFDYELEILKNTFKYFLHGVLVAEWNGHKHQEIPDGDSWAYLVQYTAGAEGWNCIKTDTIIFYSQNYSYKVMVQASGRIDRLNTPYSDLLYYHLKSRSGIDVAIGKALKNKKKFNEGKFYYA
jgi:superfamily II DNA or RNA helicase